MLIELFIASLNKAKILEFKKITKKFLKDLKIRENSSQHLKSLKTLRHLKSSLEIKIYSPLDCLIPSKNLTPPKENGLTYEENARIKALWFKNLITKTNKKEKTSFFLKKTSNKRKEVPPSLKKTFFLGEDSGLEIKALKGFPGLFSSRFAKKNSKLDSSKLLNPKSIPILEILKKLSSLKGKKREASFKSTLMALDTTNHKEIFFTGILEGTLHEKAKGKKGFGYDNLFIPHKESKTLAEMGIKKKNSFSHRSKAFLSFLNQVINH